MMKWEPGKALGWMLALIVGVTNAPSQDHEYTDPIGVMAYRIEGGTSEVPVTTMIALPLADAPAATGASPFVVTAQNGDSITSTGAGWVESALAMAEFPYDIRFRSGDAAGARFAVAANTSDSLTLTGRSLADFTLNAGSSGDEAELVPVDTLELLFGGALFRAGATPDDADRVTVFVGSGRSGAYFIDQGSSIWLSAESPFAPAGDTRLPAEGGLAITRTAGPLSVVVAGQVSSTQVNLAVANSGSTFTNSGFPVDFTLGELALQTRISGWTSNINPSVADVVGLAAGGGWVYYFHTGSQWQRVSGPTTNRDDVVVAAGKPIRIIRRGETSGSTELIISLP